MERDQIAGVFRLEQQQLMFIGTQIMYPHLLGYQGCQWLVSTSSFWQTYSPAGEGVPSLCVCHAHPLPPCLAWV